MKQPPEQPKEVDPLEVFRVIGASGGSKPEELKETAEQIDASPEVVEFMEKLPDDTTEPSEVVAAASDPDKNEAGVKMDMPSDPKPELTVDDILDEHDLS